MLRMICYIPGCIRYGSEHFGLGSLRDYFGLAGVTPQFYSVARYRFDYQSEWSECHDWYLKTAKVKTIFDRSVGHFRPTGRSVTIWVKINHSNSNCISFEFNLLRTIITEVGTYSGTFFCGSQLSNCVRRSNIELLQTGVKGSSPYRALNFVSTE